MKERTRSRFSLSMLALVFAVAPASVSAASCDLKQVASVQLYMGRQTNAAFVPVRLNGAQKFLLVDTGGIVSTLAPDVAQELSLPTHASPAQLENVAGQVLDTVAVVQKFQFGDFRSARIEFLLEPANDHTGGFGGQLAGTLAPDILQNYDVELDFAAAKMNLFEPADCANGAYWSTDAPVAVDMTINRAGHIELPIMLDGHRLNATLDTGMSITTLNLDTARRIFGIDVNAPDVSSAGSLTGDARGTVYTTTLHTLATEHGEIAIDNPRVWLMPDLTTDVVDGVPDVILGLSTLKQLHLYIAYRRQKLFVTPASGPPAVTIAPVDEPAANPLRRQSDANSLRRHDD